MKKKTKGKKKKKIPEKKISEKEMKRFLNRLKCKVLKKYGDLVKSMVVMGSVARGEFKSKSDVDVFVVLDDTEKPISRAEKGEIDDAIEKMAKEISPALSIQPSYTLTEFWDYARVCNPIIYNFIKEGKPLHDVGFFMPVKRLLEMGKIPSTREAIESYMEGAPKKLMRAKTVKLFMLAEDCYYAMLNTAQAVLMFMGVEPPVPSKAYAKVKKYLVDPGILEQKYADWLKEIIEIRKKIEHKELMDVKGAFVDEWIEKSEKFIEKMFQLLSVLELRKKEKVLERTHDVMHKAALAALKTLHNIPKEAGEKEVKKKLGVPIKDAFKRDFIDKKLVEGYYYDIWKRIEVMKGLMEQKKSDKIAEKDVYKMREYVRNLIRDLAKVIKEREKTEKTKGEKK